MKNTRKTYVYIDASNIRNACRISCGFYLDFVRLYKYLKTRYPNLSDVRYYEGIYKNDSRKINFFKKLKRVGYTVCPMERKKYVQEAKRETVNCWKCGTPNRIEVLGEVTKYKSNVDVYLASDMLLQVAMMKKPLNIVLLSCDGDYVELIKNVLKLSPETCLTVLATPNKRNNNMLSYRLKRLSRELGQSKYRLENIETIKDYISSSPKNSRN